MFAARRAGRLVTQLSCEHAENEAGQRLPVPLRVPRKAQPLVQPVSRVHLQLTGQHDAPSAGPVRPTEALAYQGLAGPRPRAAEGTANIRNSASSSVAMSANSPAVTKVTVPSTTSARSSGPSGATATWGNLGVLRAPPRVAQHRQIRVALAVDEQSFPQIHLRGQRPDRRQLRRPRVPDGDVHAGQCGLRV